MNISAGNCGQATETPLPGANPPESDRDTITLKSASGNRFSNDTPPRVAVRHRIDTIRTDERADSRSLTADLHGVQHPLSNIRSGRSNSGSNGCQDDVPLCGPPLAKRKHPVHATICRNAWTGVRVATIRIRLRQVADEIRTDQ